LIPSQPVFAANTSFLVFGLSGLGLEKQSTTLKATMITISTTDAIS
jgi:hypothetical protein